MSDRGLSLGQRAAKRAIDLVVASVGLLICSPVLVLAVVVATVDTREWGIFSQERIGRHGVPFRLYKIRTMRTSATVRTTVTRTGDPRITRSGRLMRALKLDELPQLINVVKGDMSLVGPRPDVSGFADRLEGPDRVILTVRPGITGPASIAYRHEEKLLADSADPEHLNRTVIWPDKVRINREYVENYAIGRDLSFLWQTMVSVIGRGV